MIVDLENKYNQQPRVTIGRENFFLQGFPIGILDMLKDNAFKEKDLTDLAGNMVSVPVFLAILMSAVASLSWVETEQLPSINDNDAATGKSVADGLMHGGPDGSDVVPKDSFGQKRRPGGQLSRVYGKIQKK